MTSEDAGRDAGERSNRDRRGDRSHRADDDDPVLPDVTSDERGGGWGEGPDDRGYSDDWYRRERPPHHGD